MNYLKIGLIVLLLIMGNSMAQAEDKCTVTGTTNTPVNIRNAPNGGVVGQLKIGDVIYAEYSFKVPKEDPLDEMKNDEDWRGVENKERTKITGWVNEKYLKCDYAPKEEKQAESKTDEIAGMVEYFSSEDETPMGTITTKNKQKYVFSKEDDDCDPACQKQSTYQIIDNACPERSLCKVKSIEAVPTKVAWTRGNDGSVSIGAISARKIKNEAERHDVAIEGVIVFEDNNGLDDFIVTDNKERYGLLFDYWTVCKIGDRCLIHTKLSPYDTNIANATSMQNLNTAKARNKP